MASEGTGQGDRSQLFITGAELAWRWHRSSRTLQRWRKESSKLPHVIIGGRVLYRMSDVEAVEAAGTTGGPA